MNPTDILDVAREAIEQYLRTGKVPDAPENLSADLNQRAGAFVSLHEPNGDLRGCIGTIAPTQANLAQEVIANAISAATRDPRFEPVTAADFQNLEISVDVLSKPVPESDITKLEPKKFGIIVSAADGRQGVLLPDLEGVDTAAGQIAICRQKGGIGPDEPVEIRKFTVKRY